MKKRTAVDMGASTIRVIAPKAETAATCPALAALDCAGGSPVCFGEEAERGLQRMPGSMDRVYPLLEPESVTTTVLEGLFSCAAELAHPSGRFHTDLVLSIPASISEEQESAYPESASLIGAKDVFMVGALHAVSKVVEHAPNGQTAILHIGASTAELGIFSGGECIIQRAMRIGGRTYDDLLGDFIYDRFGLLLDVIAAEELKIRLSALSFEVKTITASGIHRKTGLPRTMQLEADALRAVLITGYRYLIDALLEMIGKTGEAPVRVVLTGGSAPICGLLEAIADQLPEATVVIAPHPEEAVIRGLREMILADEVF